MTMKYIELYLNKRQEELEKQKEEEISRFKREYRNANNNDDIESLLENVVCDYYIMVDSINMRLKEIEDLRNDLIPKNKEDNLKSPV